MITWPLLVPPFFIPVPSLLDSPTFSPVTEVISAAKRTSVAAHVAASVRGSVARRQQGWSMVKVIIQKIIVRLLKRTNPKKRYGREICFFLGRSHIYT